MGDDVGEKLRTGREAAGMSLAALAKLTNYSRCHLSNVETGKRRATPDVVLAYERALDEGNLDRRTLLTGLAASVIAPMAVAEILYGAFTDAMSHAVPVEVWWQRAEAYGRDYMNHGAQELSARLVGDMVRLNQHLDDPDVWAPAARLMTVYGKTLAGNDGSRGAVGWYQLAVQIADRSEDLPTRIWVRGRSALALAYEAVELSTARLLARQALALANGKPSLGRLNAVVAQAHVAGARGDHGLAVGLMRRAAKDFEQIGSAEQVSDFTVPEWRFWTFASMLYARIGDERSGVEAQEAADRCRPRTLPRFATHIELHRGLLMTRTGNKRAGVAYAQAALERLAPAKRSLSLQLMMAEIERASA